MQVTPDKYVMKYGVYVKISDADTFILYHCTIKYQSS